ncbi:MAG: hypothetical protein ACJ8CR_08900 [Roseiflexaceae bacterium]
MPPPGRSPSPPTDSVRDVGRAAPTPGPSRIISRAAGTVISVTAEEQDGPLIITLEVVA